MASGSAAATRCTAADNSGAMPSPRNSATCRDARSGMARCYGRSAPLPSCRHRPRVGRRCTGTAGRGAEAARDRRPRLLAAVALLLALLVLALLVLGLLVLGLRLGAAFGCILGAALDHHRGLLRDAHVTAAHRARHRHVHAHGALGPLHQTVLARDDFLAGDLAVADLHLLHHL